MRGVLDIDSVRGEWAAHAVTVVWLRTMRVISCFHVVSVYIVMGSCAIVLARH